MGSNLPPEQMTAHSGVAVGLNVSIPHAIWWSEQLASHAADELGLSGSPDGRLYHPGVRSHLGAALTQLRAAVELTKPEHDQVKAA